MRVQVQYNDDGLTALIFTAEGDMRQAINNLQSTFSGFGFVSGESVFKVCDQPHPARVQRMVSACHKGDVEGALQGLQELWGQGYSAVDIVVTVFRVTKTFDELPEYTKLEFIKVRGAEQLDLTGADRWFVASILGDRLHAYARARGCRDARAAERAHRAPVQDGAPGACPSVLRSLLTG